MSRTLRALEPIPRRRGPRLSGLITGLLTLWIAVFIVGCGASRTHLRTVASVPAAPPTTSSSAASTTPSTTAAGPAIAATNALATTLLPRLSGPGGNTVFSPYSIATALAMVDQGAAGATQQQIDRVLGGASGPAALAAANGALARALVAATSGQGPRPPVFASANALWLASALDAERPFLAQLSDAFGAPAQRADFAGDPDGARATINGWAASHTDGQIRELMPPDSITPATVLVLADALFLKARWQQPFAAGRTTPGPFRPPVGPAITVPFMTFDSPARLESSVSGSTQAVELPYTGSTLALLAVMPRAATLPAFERGLTGAPGELTQIVGDLRPGLVQLRMPRLDLTLQTSLSGPLAALGMPDAFTSTADFSGIATGRRLAIEAVEHAARLKVDEAGTVAAAATGVSVAPTAILGGIHRTISLDHPFLLFLRDTATGTILFAARVQNPADG